MSNIFAIVRDADGELISHESDDALNRLSDVDLLTNKGCVRVPVAQQLPVGKRWDKVQRKQVDIAAPVATPDETLRLALLAIVPATASTGNIFSALQLILKGMKL